jgi:hypothetical protein
VIGASVSTICGGRAEVCGLVVARGAWSLYDRGEVLSPSYTASSWQLEVLFEFLGSWGSKPPASHFCAALARCAV